MERSAVVLVSGGLDSAVTLAHAAAEGFECHAISFDYGQRHAVELRAAARVSRAIGVRTHAVVRVDLRAIGGSALTDDIEVPKDRAGSGEIPVTYVPARNLVFLSLASALAERLGARDLFIGVNAIDYSGYPDCRPEFIASFERTANLATRAGVESPEPRFRVHAPLLAFTKAEIVRLGRRLGVDFALTHSCYDPDVQGAACGRCDSCVIRRRAFAEAGAEDPVAYA